MRFIPFIRIPDSVWNWLIHRSLPKYVAPRPHERPLSKAPGKLVTLGDGRVVHIPPLSEFNHELVNAHPEFKFYLDLLAKRGLKDPWARNDFYRLKANRIVYENFGMSKFKYNWYLHSLGLAPGFAMAVLLVIFNYTVEWDYGSPLNWKMKTHDHHH